MESIPTQTYCICMDLLRNIPRTTFDNVEIPSNCLISAMNSLNNDEEKIRKSKINVLKQLNLIDENTSFVIGHDGILNEDESLLLLQV